MTRQTEKTCGSLTVGCLQIGATGDLQANAGQLADAVARASAADVQLLVTPECTLTGYPPIERTGVADLSCRALAEATDVVCAAAAEYGVTVVLGTMVHVDGRWFDAVQWIDAQGRVVGWYAKRAMYGADARFFSVPAPGMSVSGYRSSGVFECAGVRVGVRICFEFRFPEYFRPMLAAGVDLVTVGLCMVGPTGLKLPVARGHLVSRAAENGFAVVSANSATAISNAPTGMWGPSGQLLAELSDSGPDLLVGRLELDRSDALVQSIRRHALGLQNE